MKIPNRLIIGVLALGLTPAFAQQPQPARPVSPPARPPGAPFNERLATVVNRVPGDAASVPELTRFNLDFPGGTPKQLVAAIEKAMNRPLNVIIPNEAADQQLPPLKMNNIDIGQLASALERASNTTPVSYGLTTTDGVKSDDSIWSFYSYRRNSPPSKVCRFYSLSPFLQKGYTVDDITTAVQTGWRMLGDSDTPAISYHKETRLLIGVGESGKLEIIDAVLNALQGPKSPWKINPATGVPESTAPIPQRIEKK